MDLPRTHDLDRRALVTRLGATLGAGALGTASSIAAQSSQEEAAPEDALRIRLLSNLFTRVGAAVHINGRGPFVFVIDTGAGTTSIADTVADQLALPPLAPMLVHGITTAMVTRGVAVNRLLINQVGFRHLHCPVFERGQLGADGLIGLDVLGQFRLRFDALRRSASLTVPGVTIRMGSDLPTRTRIPGAGLKTVRGRFGQMILTQVQVDGQRTAAFVDSGAQYSIGNMALLRAIASRRRGPGLQAPRLVPIFGVTGQTLVAELAQVNDLRLGSTRAGATPMLFADLHCFETLELAGRPAMLIGADLLGRFRAVTLDFPANSVIFTGLRRQSVRELGT